MVVARHIEIVARVGRVGFDKVVRSNDALWLAC